jgi:hypothetical protein
MHELASKYKLIIAYYGGLLNDWRPHVNGPKNVTNLATQFVPQLRNPPRTR